MSPNKPRPNSSGSSKEDDNKLLNGSVPYSASHNGELREISVASSEVSTIGKKFCPVESAQAQTDNNKTIPLDVAPERLTKRCTSRFRPGGRFWSEVYDTFHQAVRESNVSPETIHDRSLSFA